MRARTARALSRGNVACLGAVVVAVSLTLGACGTSGASTDPARGEADGRDAPSSVAWNEAGLARLLDASREQLDAEVAPVSVPEALAQRVGTLGVGPALVDPGRSIGVAAPLTTADLDPAAVGGPTPAAPPTLSGAEFIHRVALAGADGSRTIPLALADDGSVVATRTAAAPAGRLLPEEPYEIVALAADGTVTALPQPEPWPGGGPAGFADPETPDAEVPQQAVRASTTGEEAVWIQSPDTDLYTLTWQLVVGELDGSGTRVVADAQDLLGVEGPIPAFSQWNTPVLADGVAYQATSLPAAEGPWTWDADGSRWTGGLAAAPVGGAGADTGDDEPSVLAAGTRLVASDGGDVVRLVDGALLGAGGSEDDQRRYALVEQNLGEDATTWVSGELPAGSAVTAVALSPQLLVWVITHYDTESATLLAVDRETAVLHSVELGDLLASPSVAGRRVGWGNWSGNGDPGEYLVDVPAEDGDAAPLLVRLGENRGGSRVRVAGNDGEWVGVTGTIGDPATGPTTAGIGGTEDESGEGAAQPGTLEEVVLRVP